MPTRLQAVELEFLTEQLHTLHAFTTETRTRPTERLADLLEHAEKQLPLLQAQI